MHVKFQKNKLKYIQKIINVKTSFDNGLIAVHEHRQNENNIIVVYQNKINHKNVGNTDIITFNL